LHVTHHLIPNQDVEILITVPYVSGNAWGVGVPEGSNGLTLGPPRSLGVTLSKPIRLYILKSSYYPMGISGKKRVAVLEHKMHGHFVFQLGHWHQNTTQGLGFRELEKKSKVFISVVQLLFFKRTFNLLGGEGEEPLARVQEFKKKEIDRTSSSRSSSSHFKFLGLQKTLMRQVQFYLCPKLLLFF
jgi:hypothetical protein